MALLNSPFSVLVVLLVIAATIFFRKRSGMDRRCSECKSGLMEETKATPEKLLSGTSIDTTSTASVLFTVTYQCSHCDNRLVRTESRK